MQAVCFVMGLVFTSGSGVVRVVLFCRRVGFPKGQLYAALFVVLIVLCGICSWRSFVFCRRVGFPKGQLYAALCVVLGGLRKCKPFVLSRCFFLHAVFVHGGALCFVVVLVFPRGSCTQLCLWF